MLSALLILLLPLLTASTTFTDTANCPCLVHLSLQSPIPAFTLSTSPSHNFSVHNPSLTSHFFIPTPGTHTLSVQLTNTTNIPSFNLRPIPYIPTLHTPPSHRPKLSCTATLLSHHWLLTAANCPLTSIWHVRFHSSQTPHPISRIIPHPSFSPSHHRFDIALVQLQNPAPVHHFISLYDHPVIPQSPLFNFPAFQPPLLKPPLLHHVNAPVLDPAVCSARYAAIDPSFRLEHHLHICVANPPQTLRPDCSRRSGAPLLHFDNLGRPSQLGVASSCFRSAPSNAPEVYTRTSSFIEWMRRSGAQFSVTSDRQTIDRCPTRLPHEAPVERQIQTHMSANSSVPTRQISPRIIGGDLAAGKTRRYMVSLVSQPSTTGGIRACTGSLLSKRWVLTAGHCAVAQDWDVRIGKSSLFASDFTISIEQVFTHELLAGDDRQYDIALVKLASDAPPNSRFVLVNANDGIPKDQSFVRAIGYGTTEFGEFTSNILRQVDLPVVNSQLCAFRYQSLSSLMQISEEFQMCAGYLERGGCDSCQGDSGGPLIQFNRQGLPVQVAIISFAHKCAEPGFPGINTRTSAHITWMRSKGAEFEISRNAQQVFVNEPERSPIPGASPFPIESPLVEVPLPSSTTAPPAPSSSAATSPTKPPPQPQSPNPGKPTRTPKPRPSGTSPDAQSPSEEKPVASAEATIPVSTPETVGADSPDTNADPAADIADGSSGNVAGDDVEVAADDVGIGSTPIIVIVVVAGVVLISVIVLFVIYQSRTRQAAPVVAGAAMPDPATVAV